MLACARSAVLTGVEATPVTVEVDVGPGLPTFTIVGLPDASVSEARDRVRAAIKHLSEPYPKTRITVNLAPSDVRKQGPGLDLAIALCLLAAEDAVPHKGLAGRMILGELGLAGDVRPVRGALASAEVARRDGLREVVCPAPNAPEAALAGLPVVGVRTLREAILTVQGRGPEPHVSSPEALLAEPVDSGPGFASIRGQEEAKRAMEIAAAGGHNVLLNGPPGAGKTLLARALPEILPPLTLDEALEVTRIWSAAGLLPPGEALVRTRPFRSPHHGVSVAGMVGGGSGWIRPGEVTLAHRGTLFLDEFPEFPRSTLESLRQPLEDGVVTVTRSRHTVTYPAKFMLAAAMNPCPCGNPGTGKQCKCTPVQRQSYRGRVSGPLLDRIDIHLHVPPVETDELLSDPDGESGEVVRKRVIEARIVGAERGSRWGATCNAELGPGCVLRACALTGSAGSLLSRTSRRARLSARAVHRVLRVARTIADLAGDHQVSDGHLLEALNFRVPGGVVR